MISMLRHRQRDTLNAIKRLTQSQGYPPTIREIATAINVTSSSTAHSFVKQLEKLGYIKNAGSPRTLLVVRDPDENIK